MKLVADTNVLMTYYWADSYFGTVLSAHKVNAPLRALEEIQRHEGEIMKKTGLARQAFNKKTEELFKRIEIVRPESYKTALKEAGWLISQAEFSEEEKAELLDDIAFIALAYEKKCPLWSQDRLLKKQKLVPVLDTREIIELLG